MIARGENATDDALRKSTIPLTPHSYADGTLAKLDSLLIATRLYHHLWKVTTCRVMHEWHPQIEFVQLFEKNPIVSTRLRVATHAVASR